MPVCPSCGWEGMHLQRHYRYSPSCLQQDEDTKKRHRGTAKKLFFKARFANVIQGELMKAHYEQEMDMPALTHMLNVITSVLLVVMSFIQSSEDAIEACKIVTSAVQELPSAATIVEQGKKRFLRVEPLIYTGARNEDKKGAVFFSLIQLITVMLQESQTVRAHTVKSSKLWKSGDLYQQRPRTSSDTIHGKAFYNNSKLCAPATPEEENDLRVGVVGWTDEFTTVDGLGTSAKEHKYGAFLAALLNLPLHLRHHFDFLLLLCLYRVKYAAKHGGLVRMLTGVDADGKYHDDGLTLAKELEISDEQGTWIQLPNDDNEEDIEPVDWRLRIYFVLISLDWLAAGDFGPFAKSVAARYPCFKCKWTASCPCGFKPSDAVVTHSAHCRGKAPRTHDSVMEEVRQLRSIRAATQRKAFGTRTGIFSAHFASEHILFDVVRDVTVDVMHVLMCGMARYMLSWLLDIFCPADFTYAELNKRVRAHRFGKDVKVPDLERSKAKRRGSAFMKLNGAATMHFTLAS